MFRMRADAKPVADLSSTRRFMPYLSPGRNASLVYYSTEIEVDAALAFLEEQNQDRAPDRKMTLFHLYLRSLAFALKERPGVNRFVAGGRIWQRDGVWITLSAKQTLRDGAPVLTLKRRFQPEESLDEMVDELLDRLLSRRAGEKSTADKEVDLALRMPGFAVGLILRGMRLANSLGLLPRSIIDSDPMFASVFVANLGSVGLAAGYHHLWEYGTCSIFAVMGRVRERSDGKRVMDIHYSYDERIADGLYAALTLDGIRARFKAPENLL